MKESLYKGFKKVAEDQQKATLEHENGHKLTIAKKGLSKDHLKALSSLPIHQAEGSEDGPIGQVYTPMEEDQLAQYQEPVKAKEEVKSSANSNVSNIPHEPLFGLELDLPNTNNMKFDPSLSQGPVVNGKTQEQFIAEKQSQAQGQGSTPAASTQGTAVQEPTTQANTQSIAPTPNTYVNQAPQAAQQTQTKEEEIPEDATMADVINNPNLSTSTKEHFALQEFQKTNEAQQAADNEFMDKVKNADIKPHEIFDSPSLLGNIGRGIGLIMGGLSGGMLGQPNPVLAQMNKEIERDVEAQRDNLTNKYNLYKFHLNNLQNQSAAALQTATNLRQIALSKMDEQLGLMGNNPMAKLRLQAARAELNDKIAQGASDLARFHMLQGAMNQTTEPGQSGAHEIPDSADPWVKQSFRVPGSNGTAQKFYARDEKSAQEAQTQSQAIDELQNTLKEINSFNMSKGPTALGGRLAITSDQGLANSLNERARTAITTLESGGKLNARLLGALKEGMPIAGAWTGANTQGKALGAVKIIKDARNSLLNAYAINGLPIMSR